MRLFKNYTRKSPITIKLKTWISERSYYSHWPTTLSSWQWASCRVARSCSIFVHQKVDFERSSSSHHCHCLTRSTASHFWGCSWAGCFLVTGWFRWRWPACCCRAAGVKAVAMRGHGLRLRCWSCRHRFLRSSQSLRSCSHCCCSSVQ